MLVELHFPLPPACLSLPTAGTGQRKSTHAPGESQHQAPPIPATPRTERSRPRARPLSIHGHLPAAPHLRWGTVGTWVCTRHLLLAH